jgi:hypothetical protein
MSSTVAAGDVAIASRFNTTTEAGVSFSRVSVRVAVTVISS